MLYETLRPETLADVIGNDHIKKVLGGENPPHASLITGKYGSGKTTIARAFARHIGDVDIIEHDCGSQGDIGTIKEVVQNAQFPSMFHTYKVIILDEVHKLSKEAQTVLLKPVEEPLKYAGKPKVYWVLCTSEPDKILPALKSRTNEFNLQPVDKAELREALKRVLATGGMKDLNLEGGKEDWAKVIEHSEASYRKFYNLVEVLAKNAGPNSVVLSERVDQILGIQQEDSQEDSNLIAEISKASVSGILNAIADIKAAKGEQGAFPTAVGLYSYHRKVVVRNPKTLKLFMNLAKLLSDKGQVNWYSLEYAILSAL